MTPEKKRIITPHKGDRSARLYARITPELQTKINQIKTHEGISVADLIEKLVEDYFEEIKENI